MVVRVSNSGGPAGTVSSREFTPPTSTEPDRRHPALRRRIHQDLTCLAMLASSISTDTVQATLTSPINPSNFRTW
jgi:hypothetical protein